LNVDASVGFAKDVASAVSAAKRAGAQVVVFFAGPLYAGKYYDAKRACLHQPAPGLEHLASQWIDLSRANPNYYALQNITLQMCAKLGHTPFVLAGPTSKAGLESLLCGIDVCHITQKHAQEHLHIVAGLVLRHSNGEVAQAWSCQGKISGESIPQVVWEAVVDKSACSGKRVVIHRDGRFTDIERSFLAQHAKQARVAGNEFGLVEIVKHAAGTPRMYQGKGNAPAGSFLRLSETEGMLTSGSYLGKGTRNPLLVRVVSSDPNVAPAVSVQDAAEDIFRLSSLSYATLYQAPRLPVTTNTADKVAYFHASLEKSAADSKHSAGKKVQLTDHGRQQYWL